MRRRKKRMIMCYMARAMPTKKRRILDDSEDSDDENWGISAKSSIKCTYLVVTLSVVVMFEGVLVLP